MNKLTMNGAAPKNLYLDRRVVAGARSYVKLQKQTLRAYSLSQLVQDLLVRELRKQRVKLPPEFLSK
jgi:hypothetical protein